MNSNVIQYNVIMLTDSFNHAEIQSVTVTDIQLLAM